MGRGLCTRGGSDGVMNRFLPKSLVGQLLSLVALILLVAQGINFVLLYRGAQNQKMIAASAPAIARIAAEMDRMTDSDVVLHRGQRHGPPHFRRIQPSITDASLVLDTAVSLPDIKSRATMTFDNLDFGRTTVMATKVDRLPETFADSVIGLRRHPMRDGHMRGPVMRGHQVPPVEGFILLSVQLENGRWINLASAVRDRRPRLIRNLVFQTLLLYLLMLVPLIVLGRYISKPLKQLTRSAQNYTPNNPEPVDESGPPDVRQLINAFNKMNARARNMLDEKDIMLGAIGHDLRTPLAALRIRIENVEDDAERLQMIAGIEDMDQTLDDILSLARIGRSSEERELTDVNALIETVADEFCDTGAKVDYIRTEKVAVEVRATLIRRALRNLIGNAVKYGGSAEVSVEKAADNLVINIDDDGPGIADDQISSMFEPFSRAEASRNRATGGSGLGLTLARAIARDHGGDVTIENRTVGGLRASLILPLR